MSGKYSLAIDLGTSSLKAVLYDSEFHTVSKATAETVTIYPKPNWAEQDQNQWWMSTVKVIKEAVEKAGINPEDIQGVGCCGQCHGLSIVDKDCRPLHRCLIWPDLRSIGQAESITKNTGINVAPYYTAAKLLWMKENHPELIEKTYKILLPKDFLRTKLSDAFCTEISDALNSELYNRKAGTWNKRLLEFIGFPVEKMPEVRPSHSVVGKVTEKAAKETGLKAGTPVIAGYGDGSIEPVILALKPADSILVYLGTAPALLAIPTRPEKALAPEWPVLGGVLSAGGGALLKWFKEQFGRLEEDVAEKIGTSPYRLLDEEAERVEPCSEGLLFFPHMMGERSPHNPLAKGALYGLSLGHRREHLYRAMLEGITFHLRAIWDSVRERDPDIKVNKALAFGGGAKSRLWREIIANVLNYPVYSLSEEETATLNLAVLISVGLGIHKNMAEVISHLKVRLTDEIKPTEDLREKYEKAYALYKEMELKLFQHRDFIPKTMAS